MIAAFLMAAGVVVLAGIKLSAYGDALGERTGLGAGLVGLLFLAAVTSLPELVVSTTSTIAASFKAAGLDAGALRDQMYRGGADLAVGNMVGSNAFNLILFVVMDFFQGRGAMLHRLSRNHIMSAASSLGLLGILLFGFAVCGSVWGGTNWTIPFLDVGPVTPMLPVAYLAVMILQGKLEKRDDDPGNADFRQGDADPKLVTMSAFRFYSALLVFAAMIVCGGIWLSFIGDQMAVTFKLGQSFVGTIFLAVSTSLPELVVCISAVRMGALNMAVGNVLGSNIFNLVIVFTADIGLRGGSILHYASPTHFVTMGMVMILTCIVIIGLMYRSEKHFAKLGYDVWIMLAVYIVGNVALYMSGPKKEWAEEKPAAEVSVEAAPPVSESNR